MWEKFNETSTASLSDLDLNAIDSSIAKEAVSELTRAARSRQVVILNEAHHVELDRAFAMQLARSLRQIGYRYLACETFRVDSDPSTMKYVGESVGYYSRAPMFATFLSDALADGWTFISYEPNGSGNGSRDFQMASNLVDRIFLKDPKAKVFVYVGYSHARKYPKSTSNTDGSKFAAQLKRLTGIDPLTIDQTTFYDHYDSKQQQVYYRHAALNLRGLNPQVLVDASGRGLTLSSDDRSFEYYVVYPHYELDSATGRPKWMKLPALGALIPTAIPAELLTSKFERLVYAYPANSPLDAAPLDVVRILPGQSAPKLMLPSGKEFTFEFED